MKKLLLILLSLPIIGFGQTTSNSTRILEMKKITDIWTDSEQAYSDFVDRKEIIFYEKYILEEVGDDKSLLKIGLDNKRRMLIDEIKGVTSNLSINELNEKINEWNTKSIYMYEALLKNYNYLEILKAEFFFSIESLWKTPLPLDPYYKTKLTYEEAKEEDGIIFFILRRLFSFLPYVLIISILYLIFKIIKKPKLKQ
tara:strand:+ start:1512 stop:2105 length:594 start_codon:yes stop_codon:yes gene_type:complete